MIDKKILESPEKLHPGPPNSPLHTIQPQKIKLEKYCNFHIKFKKDT